MTSQNITLHLKNIFDEGELDEDSTCEESLQVEFEGKREVERNVKEYNLDVIISVGYRINSVVGTNFRKWATQTLSQHITEGYTINPKRIVKKYDNFLDAVGKVQKLLPKNGTVETDDVLELVKTFASTWFSLESYDEDKLPQKGVTKKDVVVQADDLYSAVANFKTELVNGG